MADTNLTCGVNIDGCGVNIDGDGEYVGIWVAANRVTIDEHAYVSITVDELERLCVEARSLQHDAVQHDDCAPCGTSWGGP